MSSHISKKDYDNCIDLISLLGGTENIISFVHCMTRLRFKLKNWELAKDEEIKKRDYTTGVFKNSKNDEYQVIIGIGVAKFYNNLCEVAGFKEDGSTRINNNKIDFEIQNENSIEEIKKKYRKKNIFNNLLAFIAKIFSPIVIPLVGYGLIMSLSLLITVEWSGKGTSLSAHSHFFEELYGVLSILVNTFSLFITVCISYSVFKVMKCNPIYGIIIGLILTCPSLISMNEVDNKGASIISNFDGWTLFGNGTKYPWKINFTGLIIPMIIVALFGVYMERLSDKISNQTAKMILEPVIVIGTTFIFGIFIIAPIGLVFTNYLSVAINFLSTNDIAKYIAIPIIGGLYGPLVITGLHHSLTPIILQGQSVYGATLIQGFITISNISQGIASIAFVIVYRKIKELKSIGYTNGMSAIFGGITEPSLYTINLKYVFPLIGASIGVFCGTIIMVASNSYALQGASSIFGILMFLQHAPEATNVHTWAGGGMIWGTISVLSGGGVTLLSTILLGKTKYFKNKAINLLKQEYKIQL